MGKWRPSGELYIGGKRFKTDAPIVNFTEGPKWDATQPACIPTENDPQPFLRCKNVGPGQWAPYQGDGGRMYSARYQMRPKVPKLDYTMAKQAIRQFMIHHDGCANADMCFTVLQNERGLSCHFLVDNDGTIFQTLDLAYEGWHGSELCPESIGVEICNRADRWKDKDYYSKRGINRPVKPCKINNQIIDSFDFTKEQFDAMVLLGRALLRLLPNVPPEYPQSSPGQVNLNTIGYPALLPFNGYIGHYHLTTNKWDPGPWDFKEYLQKVRGAFSWPAWPKGEPTRKGDQVALLPEVPHEHSEVQRESRLLYEANEQRADGGYFPVGPWGESRLWHGGAHLAGSENAEIFAPFPGRLVAARMGSQSAIGSMNFALIRHDIRLADHKLEFFTLYMHLADELKSAKQADWLKRRQSSGPPLPAAGQVWRLDESIEAGSVIGHVGVAGPDDARKAQIHLELFSNDEMLAKFPGAPFETLDGTSGGRFCELDKINDPIDTNHDKALSHDELKSFFNGGNGDAFHNLVIRHASEWYAEPDWTEALKQHPKDIRKLTPAQIDQMVADQITPSLWWDDDVSAHCRLQYDGVVYHYHPITFIRWLNEKLIEAEAAAAGDKIDASAAGKVRDGVTDDRDGVGMAVADRFEEKVDLCNEKLGLKEMVQGLEGQLPPECGP
jgi:N-acetylmuramoyl-L-alanine amidase